MKMKMKMKMKIILMFLFSFSYIYAGSACGGAEGSIADMINGEKFYLLKKICSAGAAILLLFGAYTSFVSDAQDKTRQQKTWSSIFMIFGAVILGNIEPVLCFLNDLIEGD